MSHCQECVNSTPSNFNTVRPWKNSPAVKSCPRFRNVRDDFHLPSMTLARADCVGCLRAASAQSLTYSGYVQDCLSCCHGNAMVNYPSVPHGYSCPSDCCRRMEVYNLFPGYGRRFDSCLCQLCTCPSNATTILHNRNSEFLVESPLSQKHIPELSLKPGDSSSVYHGDFANLSLLDSKTPSKHEHVDSENANVECKPSVRDQGDVIPDDILNWKKKHLEQLQAQQTEVSGNNVTDELKDITTSSAAEAIPEKLTIPGPDRIKNDADCTPDSTVCEKSSTVLSDTEQLKVELKRQELKAKLYESMLRKHKQDLKSLQLELRDQKLSYEEQVKSLQQELYQTRELQKTTLTHGKRHEMKYTDAEVQTECETLPSSRDSSQIPTITRSVAGDAVKSPSIVDPDSDDTGRMHEHRLTKLQKEIYEEERALTLLRQDLTVKDQHLKTLRMTLRELSSCNCELLEKNLELEDMLQRKRNQSTGVRVDALENRFLKELDCCISELNSVANALVALSGGVDPLPSFLLCESDCSAGSTDFVFGSSSEGTTSRLKRITEMQKTIDGLRETVIRRTLDNHYKQQLSH